jgi:Tfp pilus assembly protein PilO
LAETSDQKPLQIKVVGIYVIIILALLRFLIFPLRGTVEEKKVVLGEQQETYNLKYQVFERQRENQGVKTGKEPGVEKEVLLPHLYDKGTSNSYIYSEVLEQVSKLAEKKGLAVFSLEMLEPVVGKNLSEIPIMIRLRGQPGPFIELLDAIEKSGKVLSIRSMEITKTGQDQLFSLTISAFRVEI